MPAREDVELKYRADISNLVSKLQSIEGITDKEAKAMARALDRGFKQATKAANRAAKATRAGFKKAGTSMKAAGDAAKELGDNAGDADTALGGIASGLGLISPEAEKATRFLQDMFAATEGVLRSGAAVARVLGPVAVAVAAAGAAWHKYTGELDKANDASREASKMASLMSDKHLRVKDALLLAAVATGKMTRADYERQSAMQQAQELFKDDIELARERRAELDRQIASTQKDIELAAKSAETREVQARSTQRLASATAAYGETEGDVKKGLTDVMGHTQSVSKVRTEAADRTKHLTEKLEQLNRKRALANTEVQNLDAAVKSYGGSLATVATVTDELTTSTDEQAESQAGLRAQLLRAMNDEKEAQAQLRDMAIELDVIQTDAAKRINREYEDRIAVLDEIVAKGGDQAEAARLAELAELNRIAEITQAENALHEKRVERQKALDDNAKAAHEQRIADLLEEADQIASSVASTIGSVEDLAALSTAQHEADAEAAMQRAEEFAAQGLHAEAAAERQKAEGFQDAALKAHKLAQAAAYGQIAIETALGVHKAIATNAGKPAAQVVASAAVIASGIASTAAVAAVKPPAFDIGGMVAGGGIRSRSHDSVGALLRPGEGVLTAQGVQAVGGPAGLHAANRGQPQVTVVPVPVMGHLGGLYTAEEIARRGPLRRALNRAGSSSHKRGRRGY